MDDSNDAGKSGKGLKDWLPLIVTTLTMPVLAYVMTTSVLVPKLQALVPPSTNTAASSLGSDLAGNGKGEEAPGVVASARPSLGQKARFGKIVVGLSGQGGKQLLTQFTLASDVDNFQGMVKGKKDYLIEEASSVMERFSFEQLEVPEGRGNLRTNLINAFNDALQTNAVKALYFTELAIQ